MIVNLVQFVYFAKFGKSFGVSVIFLQNGIAKFCLVIFFGIPSQTVQHNKK
jgi:hypothetical protein